METSFCNILGPDSVSENLTATVSGYLTYSYSALCLTFFQIHLQVVSEIFVNWIQVTWTRHFQTCVWQNACINNFRCAMVCDMSFSFSKGIVLIYIVFFKIIKLRPLFLCLQSCSDIYNFSQNWSELSLIKLTSKYGKRKELF